MTNKEKRKAKKFAKKMKKQALKDWIKYGDFEEWFWDRVNEYTIEQNVMDYIEKISKKWVDK